jgi:glyoxylase-like metal-dependent hydrolase (beta-lactamase superfamily II)
VDIIDLHFQGRTRAIATAVLRGPQGLTLIDPGPSSCLPVLEDGLARLGGTLRDVRLILLTHIHLDHAGATGSIAARVPHVQVGVHERGAPHLITPARLIASATRLYGDRMETLWGAFEPVPAGQVRVLTGGERLDVGGHPIRVAYTPGHAVHHVSYLDESDGTAYVGDTAGVRVVGDYTIAATPPPDIDLELWDQSLATIDGWNPTSLLLTHFGTVAAARPHVAGFREVLARTADIARESLSQGESDEERAAVFVSRMRTEARTQLSEPEAATLELAAPFEQIWAGLARYWRKRDAA